MWSSLHHRHSLTSLVTLTCLIPTKESIAAHLHSCGSDSLPKVPFSTLRRTFFTLDLKTHRGHRQPTATPSDHAYHRWELQKKIKNNLVHGHAWTFVRFLLPPSPTHGLPRYHLLMQISTTSRQPQAPPQKNGLIEKHYPHCLSVFRLLNTAPPPSLLWTFTIRNDCLFVKGMEKRPFSFADRKEALFWSHKGAREERKLF